MNTGNPPVWLLFDEHDQEAHIAAGLALRHAANEHRLRGTRLERAEADRLDDIANELEQIVSRVHMAFRAAHPPGENERPAPSSEPTGGTSNESALESTGAAGSVGGEQ